MSEGLCTLGWISVTEETSSKRVQTFDTLDTNPSTPRVEDCKVISMVISIMVDMVDKITAVVNKPNFIIKSYSYWPCVVLQTATL